MVWTDLTVSEQLTWALFFVSTFLIGLLVGRH
jgi:hypothetical protein